MTPGKASLDTGIYIAVLNKRDRCHPWAGDLFGGLSRIGERRLSFGPRHTLGFFSGRERTRLERSRRWHLGSKGSRFWARTFRFTTRLCK